MVYEDKIILFKTKLQKPIKQLQLESDQNCFVNRNTLNSSKENSVRNPPKRNPPKIKAVKLVKLVIKKYYGNPDKYLVLMNQYKNAIHNYPSLRDIDKFNYLKSLLGRVTTNTIRYFSLTGKSYAATITLLKQRFGNQEMLTTCVF
ncbi:hypothetical protein NPIL_281821 [Nephila pilipes]|uniref:Uncharacterized protein n=1 Tax=Nephila pilipes TaxID=299642 RepID=A0A8X6UKY8_NEPPI|nr:hypothetical protein NPIL_281821 [Nephila pilipes]